MEQKFAMPMFKEWVPQAVRPWLYLTFALIFQLSGTIYLGAAAHEAGTMGLMREDIMMIGMMGVVGVNLPFPFLFKFKMAYPNKTLLLNAALVIIVCNILSVYTESVPLLCALSFIAGFLKLCGTFECFSNIRLWISPKQEFGVFLPCIYIVILAAQNLQAWLTVNVVYYCGFWQAINWVMTAVMVVMALLIFILTNNKMFMPPHMRGPLKSLDWLGCLLWAALMLEVIFLFLYGEYYNWYDSPVWRAVFFAFPVTLFITIRRMNRIRHPYITAWTWKHKRMVPILGLFLLAEVMNSTPRVLQNTLTGAVLHWGEMTTAHLELWGAAGVMLGCLFTIWWGVVKRRRYTQLLTIAFAAMLYYQVAMYFSVSDTLNIERLWLPTLARHFGYAIFFSTMTLYLKWLIPFPTFFMALTISGFIRNGVAESAASGLYSYSLRYHIADSLVRVEGNDIIQVVMTSIKQTYGWLCLIGLFILLAMLLYEVNSVRTIVKRIPMALPRFS